MQLPLPRAPRQSSGLESGLSPLPTSPLLAFSRPHPSDDSRAEEMVFERLVFGEEGRSSPAWKASDGTEERGELGSSERERLWQRVLLRLSDHFVDAALRRPYLSSVLTDILDNLYEYLFLFGTENDLMALDEWMEGAHYPEKSAV